MEMPALLPAEYAKYSSCLSNVDLLEKLIHNPADLVAFIKHAAEDETWSEAHRNFMNSALKWLTIQFFEDRLLLAWVEQIAKSVQDHFSILDPCLIKDLTIQVKNHSIPMNSLMLGASSERFRDLLRNPRQRQQDKRFLLFDESLEIFSLLLEYVNKGMIKDLWKHLPSELIELLQLASRYEIQGLKDLCQNILKRYVDNNNVIDQLKNAYKESWPILKVNCCKLLNEMHLGVKIGIKEKRHIEIMATRVEPLCFEFINFNDSALSVFDQLKDLITHLIFSGHLSEDPSFSKAVNACPNMISLDISGSRSFSDRIQDIPSYLPEIDISKCLWLTDINFGKIISFFPSVTRLTVNSNVQLTYKAWVHLNNLSLQALDISRCSQVADDSLELILKSSLHLLELGVEDCKRISEKGFFHLGRTLNRLIILNAARCNITDGACIDIATRCASLRGLNLSRCPSISDKGILQVIKLAGNLQELIIEGCHFDETTLEKIKILRPNLCVIF